MSELPALPVPRSREAAPFWDAALEGRLVLPVCDSCGHHIWYPRDACSACGHDSVTWTEMSGQGTVYARTIARRGMGPWKEAAPYVVAYVELAEGPRILTNVVTDDPESVQVGAPVVATFVPVADAPEDRPQSLLRFRPA